MPVQPATKNATILVIDPSPKVGELMRLILQQGGYSATVPANLDEALRLLGSMKFDVIIANYIERVYKRGERWPVLEMLKELAGPATPFIILTVVTEGEPPTTEDLGVGHVLGKPFDMEDLFQRIARCVSPRGE